MANGFAPPPIPPTMARPPALQPLVLDAIEPVFPHPPPNERQLRRIFMGGWGVMVLLAVIFTLGLFFFGVLAWSINREHAYASRGLRADAEITRVNIKVSTDRRGGKNTYHEVTYRFTDSAQVGHEETDDVSAQRYDTLHVGDHHPVEYLPEDATICRLAYAFDGGYLWVLLGFGIVFVGGVTASFALLRLSACRRARVVLEGQAVPGQITRSETRGAGKYRSYVLQFRYVDLDGLERQPKRTIRTSFKTIKRLPAGSVIAVCVDPADPGRPEPDLWGLRRMPRL